MTEHAPPVESGAASRVDIQENKLDIDMKKFLQKFQSKASKNTAEKRLMNLRKFQPDYEDEQNFLVQKIIMRKGLVH